MAQLSFGPSQVWGERIDNVVTDPVTNITTPASGVGPRQFGIIQKSDVNFTFTDKPLYGAFQFPVAIARGQGKIDGKATNAQFNMLIYSDIFFGLTPTPGQFSVASREIVTNLAGSHTVTNAATYLDDLGVRYKATGNAFNRVNPPANAGEYNVNLDTGVYSFTGADSGKDVIIAYAYATADTGLQLSITNQPQGVTPAFKFTGFQETSPGQAGQVVAQQPLAIRLNACVASKLTFPAAVDAWNIPEMDFMAFSDASGEIGILSLVQQ